MRNLLILCCLPLLFTMGCDLTAPEERHVVVTEIRTSWPGARGEIAAEIDIADEPKLGDWDLAIAGEDADRLVELRTRDWGKFRALSDAIVVIEFGELLARL